MIPFNVPCLTGNELTYIQQVIREKKLCGDGIFTKKCHQWLEENLRTTKALLTTSCTHSLEMTSLLVNIQPGDEVIMPSYAFVSSANAFVLQGARIKFVDIRPDTMNMDENLIEPAITKKTKVIVPIHYAGVACDMTKMMNIATRYGLFLIEDAAMGLMATYQSKALGTLGHFGCLSFHETKNYTMGEGGALLIQPEIFVERAEIIREKGTNRNKFLKGQVDKYTWVDKGSSYLPSELNAACLFAQLEKAGPVNLDRKKSWKIYQQRLTDLQNKDYIRLPVIPPDCEHNAHMFYIKTRNREERTDLLLWLYEHEINAAFHYIPLHSSPGGKKFGEMVGEDIFTTQESNKLIRLPLYYGLQEKQIDEVCDCIKAFYHKGSMG